MESRAPTGRFFCELFPLSRSLNSRPDTPLAALENEFELGPPLNMENRILLGKYRALLDPADMPIELRRTASSVTCKGEEIESGREVALDIVTRAT